MTHRTQTMSQQCGFINCDNPAEWEMVTCHGGYPFLDPCCDPCRKMADEKIRPFLPLHCSPGQDHPIMEVKWKKYGHVIFKKRECDE